MAGYAGSSASESAGLAVVKKKYFFQKLIKLNPEGIPDHLAWSFTWHRLFCFCQLSQYLSK